MTTTKLPYYVAIFESWTYFRYYLPTYPCFARFEHWEERAAKKIHGLKIPTISKSSLIFFWPMFPFHTPPPWKHQKTKGFCCFQGVESGRIGQEWVNDITINGCTLIQNNFIDIRLLKGGSRTAPNIYNEALGKPLIVFVKTCLKGS